MLVLGIVIGPLAARRMLGARRNGGERHAGERGDSTMTAMRRRQEQLMEARSIALQWLLTAGAIGLGGCGASSPPPQSTTTPTAYAGRCDLVGIEEVPAPSEQEGDSIQVIARYSPGAPASSSSDLAYRFQIARARVHDLRAHLQAHPSVVCEPDRNTPPKPETTHVDAPSFEGQQGQLVGDVP
jgi:hypothetical protein